jgi:hypothetical protein
VHEVGAERAQGAERRSTASTTMGDRCAEGPQRLAAFAPRRIP